MENLAEKKISKRTGEIPEPYRKGYEKAVKGGSKSAAIKAFCLECSMWQENEVTGCKAVTCPLYSVRPFGKRRKLTNPAIVMAGLITALRRQLQNLLLNISGGKNE
jgi:hypothetical protein